MAATMCWDCGIRKAGSSDLRLCPECEDYAGWENEHSDMGHGEGPDDPQPHNCPVCFPELDPRLDTPRTGHTNTVAKSHTSHAGHHHARTPGDRALCRKSIKATGNAYDARKKS